MDYPYCWLKDPDSVDFHIECISKRKILDQSILEKAVTLGWGVGGGGVEAN
jgi:hypothetical protein